MKAFWAGLVITAACGDPPPENVVIVPFNEPTGDVTEETIDIDQVAVAVAETPDAILVGIGVRTVGGPAPQTAFSNYVEVRLENGADVRQATKQRHDGADDTLVVGFEEADLLYESRPWGHFFVIPVPLEWWPPAGLTLDVETGFLATPDGELELDMPDDGAVDLPEIKFAPPDGILDEIESVFVPS
jgi:hypothetical protein